jgi:hypothetical protein
MIIAKLQNNYVTLVIATKECDPALMLPPCYRLGSLRALKLEDDNDFMKMLHDSDIQYSKDIATDLNATNLFLQHLSPEMRLYIIGKSIYKKSAELGDWFKAGAIGERPVYDLREKKRRADEDNVQATVKELCIGNGDQSDMPSIGCSNTWVDADVLCALKAIAQTVNDNNRIMVSLMNEIRLLSSATKANPMAPGPPTDIY